MTDRLSILLAQLNPTVGDLEGNAAKALDAARQAARLNADMVMLPEMFLTGYQTQDLVLKPAFQRKVDQILATLAADCAELPAVLIGAPIVEDGARYNACFLLSGGKSRVVARKHELPHTDVFDEYRLFMPGAVSGPFNLGGVQIGVPVCEDSWHQEVCTTMAESGADILLISNGSPYRRGKQAIRLAHMGERVAETGLPLVYLNMVGGQDDQVFDGASFALNPDGQLIAQMPDFDEAFEVLEIARTADGWRIEQGAVTPLPDDWEQDYHCMVMSLREYLAKSGFSKVLLGLSGGVDSALVATIAADAIGAENVRSVMLPSEYTSDHSLEDAEALAKNLGCALDTVPIGAARRAVGETLSPLFAGTQPDVTEENIQSRLRGLFLMALSNKFGEMLLTTGNKSEVAVGYATIYGDMAGGYNPIKDLYKMRVFETCRWRNTHHRDWMKGPAGAVIPERIITKPPSAELREDQKDEDSLPPYEVLDEILEALIDDDKSVAEVVAMGHEHATVKRVEHLIYLSEYKRFQSAPGCRLSLKAFWLDRRYPIVNKWRDRG